MCLTLYTQKERKSDLIEPINSISEIMQASQHTGIIHDIMKIWRVYGVIVVGNDIGEWLCIEWHGDHAEDRFTSHITCNSIGE